MPRLSGSTAVRAAAAWGFLLMGSAAVSAGPIEAQSDVEMLGRHFGTTPPPAYFEVRARDPGAFRFSRAWMARNPWLERVEPAVPGGPPRFRVRDVGVGEPPTSAGGEAAVGAAGAVQVEGTFRFPLILGEFAGEGPAGYTPAEIQAEFFDGPNSRDGTIREFYAEISGGRVDLLGETFPWVTTGLTRAQVVGSTQGLHGDARTGEYIVRILSELDDGPVDWGRFDNDGPDGIPNSGDDDGFVDILAVMHPDWGAECGGEGAQSRIWSHKWSIPAWRGNPYVTETPSAHPTLDFVRIDDYAIQPVQACGGGAINQIGVLAHELGHGFGLPDLYDTAGGHEGIGEWGLMGSGSWGCSGGGDVGGASTPGPARPCHMSAWSKSMLGWVDVVPLGPDEDHGVLSMPAVEEEGRVYRVDAGDGSGEYFLLENRQRLGFDADLHAPGLLVWHVDPGVVTARWNANQVNRDRFHMGVGLRQADGEFHLNLGSNRGDAGDPFPGSTGNPAFHASSDPASWTHQGSASGTTLLGVEPVGGEMRFQLLTGYQDVTVSVDGPADGGLVVDDVEVPAAGHTFSSAPFQRHQIVAQGGAAMGDGIREGFLEWTDDPEAPRNRIWFTGLRDTALVAAYGGPETRLRLSVSGAANGIEPGRVQLSPPTEPEEDGLWVPQGTVVSLEAVPVPGFGFVGWTGAVEGPQNPAAVDMSAPADVGSEFEVTFAVSGQQSVDLLAARPYQVFLEAVDATSPLTWFHDAGEAPEGLTLRAAGRIAGVALEDGTFVMQVRARDARGLEASGTVELRVAPPPVSVADLTRPLFQRPHGLTELEMEYLDFNGNGDGTYDLGDFRAFVLAHPDFEEGAVAAPARSVRVPVVVFPGGGGP